MVTIYNIINIMVIDYGYVFTNILHGSYFVMVHIWLVKTIGSTIPNFTINQKGFYDGFTGKSLEIWSCRMGPPSCKLVYKPL